jgi:signal transduction histidine kinase
MITGVALLAEKKGWNWPTIFHPTSPDRVKGDPGRLRQILTNLLSNAVKFTQKGEVVVTVAVEDSPADKVRLHFQVRDTGIGIPSDKLKLIFAPFTQADNSATRIYGGTGLGLAITSQLVELMGGRIWVESELDKGSTFHFTALLTFRPEPRLRPSPPGTRISWASRPGRGRQRAQPAHPSGHAEPVGPENDTG